MDFVDELASILAAHHTEAPAEGAVCINSVDSAARDVAMHVTGSMIRIADVSLEDVKAAIHEARQATPEGEFDDADAAEAVMPLVARAFGNALKAIRNEMAAHQAAETETQ